MTDPAAARPPAALTPERRAALLALLRRDGRVLVGPASRSLGVAEPTVRRDLRALAARGLAVRVHGGAVLPDGAAGHHRFSVGVVVPVRSGYYWPQVVAGIRAAAGQAQVRLDVRPVGYDLHAQARELRALVARGGVDAVVTAPDPQGRGAAALLRWLDTLPLPVVLVERGPGALRHVDRLEWVVSDHAAGAALAVRHLHGAGHRRIGLCAPPGYPSGVALRRGWHAEMLGLGLPVDDHLVAEVPPGRDLHDPHVADQVLDRWRSHDVTAALVLNDLQARCLVRRCRERRVPVPGAFSVVAYDDEAADGGRLPLTAVAPPKTHVGRTAVELAVARLVEGDARPLHRVAVTPVLTVRASSAGPGARPGAVPGAGAAAQSGAT